MLDSDHFEQAVEDLGDLLRETCDGPVDLVGHSDGGSVALLAAVRHPEAIRSVCAVSTHVYADPYTASALRALGPVQSWDERTRVLYETQHGDDWMDVVAGWIGMWLAGGLSRWDLRPELPEIEVPVLVAHDRADPLSPTLHARSIQESVQSARVSWYHTGSHRPPPRGTRSVLRGTAGLLGRRLVRLVEAAGQQVLGPTVCRREPAFSTVGSRCYYVKAR
jgi:pimeloyl-ACP methyl ester carboxylesterase